MGWRRLATEGQPYLVFILHVVELVVTRLQFSSTVFVRYDDVVELALAGTRWDTFADDDVLFQAH